MIFPVFLPPKIDLVIRIFLICLKPPDRFAVIIDLCRMVLTELLVRPVPSVSFSRTGYLIDPDSDIADGQRGDSDPGYWFHNFISPFPNP